MHRLFEDLLGQYSIKPEFIEPLKYQLEYTYHSLNKGNSGMESSFKTQIIEINKKLDNIEEKHYALNQMDKETFLKFQFKYVAEKNLVEKELSKCNSTGISNLGNTIEKAINISRNLHTMWQLGDAKKKENLQKLVFPDGIYYTREKGAFRTERVNSVFALIASLSGGSIENKKGQNTFSSSLSPSAERGGFEPPIPFWGIHAFQACAFSHSAISPYS